MIGVKRYALFVFMGKNGLSKTSTIQQIPFIKRQLAVISYILLASALFIPAYAQAGFFSDLARFFSPNTADAVQVQPEQSVAAISLPLLGSHQAAPQSGPADENDTKVDPDPAPLSVIQDSALVGSLNPLGTMSENGQDKIVAYVVQPKDTARGIANKFGISLNTLLWANDLKSTSEIKAGDSLVILPVSGVQYDVKKGDTINSIVKKFKPKDMSDDGDILSFKADILSFNNLAVSEELEPGSTIVIPDGEFTMVVPTPNPKSGGSKPSNRIPENTHGTGLPEYGGYYLRPVIGGKNVRATRLNPHGIHGYNGVDLANSCGLPVLASADGTVIIARTSGWNGGYGEYVVVSHPNGTQTLYGHMSALFVSVGQHVTQGLQIGNIGSTGNSTGCHVHFEIRGARNPF